MSLDLAQPTTKLLHKNSSSDSQGRTFLHPELRCIGLTGKLFSITERKGGAAGTQASPEGSDAAGTVAASWKR